MSVPVFIHVLAPNGLNCHCCGDPIPPGHQAQPFEFVGVIRYRGIPANSYRIGTHNREPACNGTPATAFHQPSYGPGPTRTYLKIGK